MKDSRIDMITLVGINALILLEKLMDLDVFLDKIRTESREQNWVVNKIGLITLMDNCLFLQSKL